MSQPREPFRFYPAFVDPRAWFVNIVDQQLS